jgi:hypothetical protein
LILIFAALYMALGNVALEILWGGG